MPGIVPVQRPEVLWRLRRYAASVVLVVVSCIAWVSSAAVAETVPLRLRDAVSAALRESPQAQIARLQAERAEDELSVAQSIFWPHASVTSQAGYSNRIDEELEAVDGSGRVRTYGLSSIGSDRGWFNVELEQLIFDLSRWRNVKRVELEVEAARVSADQQRDSISFEVFERYVSVLRLQRLVEIEQQRIRDGEWLDQQAALLLEAGRCLPSEREQAAVALEESRIDAALRTDELEDARRTLLAVIGGGGAADLEIELAADSVPAPADPAHGVPEDEAIHAAPELRVLELRRRMQELEVSAARAQAYPTVGLGAAYRNYGAKRGDNFPDELSIGVDFRLPLFDGMRTRYSVASAIKDAEIARLRYEAQLEEKRGRVRDLRRRLAASRSRPELAQRRERLAAERQRLADLELQAGRGSIAVALSAREQQAQASRAMVQASFEQVLAWATLQRESGRLVSAILGEEFTAEDGLTP
jgi:outer membrane protein TolC